MRDYSSAFGSAAECLLLSIAELQRLIFIQSFVNFYVEQETEEAYLLDRLFCCPDNFNHSHQITQLEKMLLFTTPRNGIGNLGTVSFSELQYNTKFFDTL